MKVFNALVLSVTVLVTTLACARIDESPYSKELGMLDDELAKASEYVHLKEQRISTISNLLNSRGVTPLQQYQVYGQLYNEYVAYQFDKAKEMLEHQERLAGEMEDASLMNDVLLEKAMLFTVAGLYQEAQTVFVGLDTLTFDPRQKLAWYNARQKYLKDYSEYVRTMSIDVPEASKIRWYQEQILLLAPQDSHLHHLTMIMELVEEKRFEEAYALNLNRLAHIDRNTRDYAVLTYWQGFICENLDLEAENLDWWIKSAVCDVRLAIKDNASLCSVAIKLTQPSETDRAFRYIRLSLEDALFFNAKLRKVQIASTLPWIQATYSQRMQQQAQERARMLAVVSVIAVLLALLGVLAVRLYMRGRRYVVDIRSKNRQIVEYCSTIEEAEKNLRMNNMALVEANAAKEEYLGLFLSMSSGYLDKLKKALPRDSYEAELRTFYKTFDTSFLQLYPTFVEEFNALLKPEAHISVKEGELLSTELRIFALIKLGITQSSHIASLLRYSVNTIYNYRAQIKNAALQDRENFESAVKTIGSRR